ncbi:PREDICTED: NAC transcription factor ONAC010-like [Ipomoea nil]|uniref:NAC transcription factor ONAC010-like n=1 Tax=Ipomoea nil TaxID=35883 RepID=UPI000900C646|nr:PREDICTED: NAC transcription factor ONAC010-like [Ipomoea nil]
MCPPATTPPDAIDLYWTDEQIFLLLEKVKNGSALPNNVSEDINTYHFLPSNLPSKIWYLVQPTESKKSEHGFWKAKGEASRIYQNGSIYGWRSTLEFFEGPNGRKTGWVLQEYKTEKGGYSEKNPKQSRSLCTVFQCCGGSPNDMPSVKMLSSAPNANRASGVGSTSESQAKSKDAGSTQLPGVDEAIDDPRNEALINQLLMEDGLELDDLTGNIGALPAANKAEDPEDIITGDFLEMNDLDGKLSPSSSSGNSSHHNSFASEDDFFATVRNMDDDNNNGDPKGKGSSYKCKNMGPVKPNEVIIQLAPSGSLVKATGSKAAVETRPTSSTNSNIHIKPPQPQPLGGRGPLHRAATKNKFKKVHGVAQKLYCDRRKTKET